MLQKVTSKRAPRAVPKSAKPFSSAAPQAANNPAPVVVPAKPDPHPVFGTAPIGRDGCTLEAQPIWALNAWHKKASKILEPYYAPGDLSEEDEKRFEGILSITWDIYNAACSTKLYSSRDVAVLLELISRHNDNNGAGNDDIVVDRDLLRRLTSELDRLTAFPRQQKKVGALRKGKKLTRAGLLLRYHAFLIGELRTLGWAFYGNDEYATRHIPMDDAVHVRTSNAFRDGKPIEDTRRRKCYPFFDESKLTDRARSVLKSLKIDTTKAERR